MALRIANTLSSTIKEYNSIMAYLSLGHRWGVCLAGVAAHRILAIKEYVHHHVLRTGVALARAQVGNSGIAPSSG